MTRIRAVGLLLGTTLGVGCDGTGNPYELTIGSDEVPASSEAGTDGGGPDSGAGLDGGEGLLAGSCGSDGPSIPASGLYTGMLVCNAQDNGGIVFSPFVLSLSLAADASQQSGAFFGVWSQIAIAGSIGGALDCTTGQFDADITNGVWGTPGSGMTVLSSAVLAGGLALHASGATTIAGTLDYTVSTAASCQGTLTAALSQ